MRYKAVFTDEFLSYFRLDDNGKTLVLTDRQGFTRAVTLEVEVEQRHGKWIKDDVGVHCSECFCGWEFLTGIPVEVYEFHYCPNCAAMMNKGDEDE